MRLVADAVAAETRYSTATNVERDAGGETIAGYLPTARSLELLRRVVAAAIDRARRRAWSVTGPYGSGKSSFAILLDALAGPSGSLPFNQATRSLGKFDPLLANSLADVHRALSTEKRGFIRALVTAEPEPITVALLRALYRGCQRYWSRGRRPSAARAVESALHQALAGERVPPSTVVALVGQLASHAPVLIVIDEFGKTLDYLRGAPQEGDLYVLQALTEAASGPSGLPVFVLTLQHMSFDEYAPSVAPTVRREWAKVQGRFEDVGYVDTRDQTIGLIGRVFRHADEAASARIERWAELTARRCQQLGLSEVVGGFETLSRTYPLHPVTLAVLPDLCRIFGQNERTLFGFLTHDEPHAVGNFLASTRWPSSGGLPAVALPDVYDYFIGSASSSIRASQASGRWFEIDDRIRQTVGLSKRDTDVLKTVGVLNLLAQGGALRASTDMVAYALGPGDKIGAPWVPRVLADLVRRGYLTHREFADEFRIWQGTDFDIERHAAAAMAQRESMTTAELVASAAVMTPVVASRHSQETGTIRVFRRDIADSVSDIIEPADFDGSITYVPADAPIHRTRGVRELPMVVVPLPQLSSLRQAAMEAAAYRHLLDLPAIHDDWVATREVAERAAAAASRLASMAGALSSEPTSAFLLSGSEPVELPRTRSASELASLVADRAYAQAPHVRNELLGRSSLTSQGARARVQLLEAMAGHSSSAQLQIEGFGPERAMYEAILARSGIHRSGENGWKFSAPDAVSSYAPAWERLTALVESSVEARVPLAQIAADLQRPPFGIKPPLFPILLTAFLLAEPDQVAIYQDGTFQPRLTGDVLERLAKAPARFELRHLAIRGGRLDLLRAAAVELGVTVKSSTRQRGAPVLSVVRPILEIVRGLPDYSRRTTDVSRAARQTREAITAAREPDVLLFQDLPVALGFDRSNGDFDAREFAAALRTVLDELTSAYPKLLTHVADLIADGLALDSRNLLKVEAAARARPLLGHVAEPRLRALLFAMTSEALDDDDWLEAVALAISERPPRMWDQADADRFEALGRSLLSAFRRVESLHYETRAHSAGTFESRRITITRPDGREQSRVVWHDGNTKHALRLLAETACAEARKLLPAAGGEALLAAIAEQVFAPDTAEDTPIEENQRERSA